MDVLPETSAPDSKPDSTAEVQGRIAVLQDKGWTLAAIADELGITSNAVEKWKSGQRHPSNGRTVVAFLDALASRKRVPKKKRYNRPRS